MIKYAILYLIVNVISVVIKIVVFQMTDADNIADYEIQVLATLIISHKKQSYTITNSIISTIIAILIYIKNFSCFFIIYLSVFNVCLASTPISK